MLLSAFTASFSEPTSTSPLHSVTRPSKRVGGSPIIPLSHPRNAPRRVEQVHLTGASSDSVHVTWSSNDSALVGAQRSVVELRAAGTTAWSEVTGGYGEVYSAFQDPAPWQIPPPVCNNPRNYTNPECFYTSGALHSVQLTSLTPATKYEYRVKDDPDGRTFGFTSPPAAGSKTITFGVVGDLGQTTNASETVDGLHAALDNATIDAVLLAGDLSYADGDHYRWDSYARLFEPLWSSVPTAHAGGNHEVSNGNENWLAYSRRYPNAHLDSGSASFLWYSFEAGPAHVVVLCSCAARNSRRGILEARNSAPNSPTPQSTTFSRYAATGPGSSQFEWLKRDLAKVDRTKTPWLIVMQHTPWYTSNAHHPMTEGAPMRAAMEPLFLSAGVDLVLTGHVHAYERTHAVADGKIDEKNGIVHVTIGDGGNREEFATPWLPDQPPWSALREYAYGWGTLALNSTHLVWEWLRNDDPWNPPGERVGDSFVLTTRF